MDPHADQGHSISDIRSSDVDDEPARFSSVCVVIDSGEAGKFRVEHALELANTLRLKLRVLALPDELGADPATVSAKGRLERESIESLAGQRSISLEWISAKTLDPLSLLESLDPDELFVGQGGRLRGRGHAFVTSLTERVLTHSRLPVILLPPNLAPGKLGTRILLAWDGTPPSRRAVNSAAPLIERAESVTVCGVLRYSTDSLGDEVLGEAHRLAAMNPAVEGVVISGAGSPGDADALIQHAQSRRCDLIVAGAYWHPRWRQRMIGGVTRSLMAKSPIALFMHR